MVITDDLAMSALRRRFSLAGLAEKMVLAVQKGVRNGRLNTERIEASVRRIAAAEACRLRQ